MIANCSQGSGISRNPQGSSRGGSRVPPPTSDRGRGRGSLGHTRRGIDLETVNRPTTTVSGRAYAMRAHEDRDAPGVITGNFTHYDNEMHALVYPGSTHSYICIEQLSDKLSSIEPIAYDMLVTSPLGHSVTVNQVYRTCPIVIQAREFLADLITLPFREFDLILGMDCLSKHQAIIDYGQKIVVLRCSDQSKVIVQGIRSGAMSNVISTMQARRLMRKGCETFLASMLYSKRGQVN